MLREQTASLWREEWAYVMAFENHGTEVGATLPHQHGQVYALDHIPPVIAAKLAALERHRAGDGTCLGCTLVAEDLASDRVIEVGQHFVAATPFAARWPHEVEVRARHHGVGRLGDLDDDAALELARLLAAVLDRFDGLWGFDLPYMLCVQEAPAADESHRCGSADWHLHVELLPPHRNPDHLKVRASVETTLGVFINDTLPEHTAAALRVSAARTRDDRRRTAGDRAGAVADVTARAPGRVNLIGDHTDYTGGFCFPIAIFSRHHGHRPAEGRPHPDPQRQRSDRRRPATRHRRTRRRRTGVGPLRRRGRRRVAAVGLDAEITSDLPQGVGLSSSAALEVAIALALGAGTTDPLALAKLCRAAEHAARQVPTGILDQLASICGRSGHGLLIDCRSLDVTAVPLPPSDEVEWRVITPAHGRDLAASQYATRVAQLALVEEAIGPLRGACLGDLDVIDDADLRARARHVITENDRVHQFAVALESGDATTAGALMTESHSSLAVDFDSSTPAIDALCRDLLTRRDVLGARITGGGWGGAVVALARPGALDDVPSAVLVAPAGGATLL